MLSEAEWEQVNRRRRAFAIVFHREGVIGGEDPVDVACRTLQVGRSAIERMCLEEFEHAVAHRLTPEWVKYERAMIEFALGSRDKRPKKPKTKRTPRGMALRSRGEEAEEEAKGSGNMRRYENLGRR